ncbi:hypothetical protein DKX38_018161 [Salix brachista]|uniref:Uncharacterized protein n=1 Tax=Salix brachista TaxID=2182728 RepID=A0A5N5KME7_9ROSI|nr:hypothetical protein DKX38_018161 [Salix brachista]
MGESKVLKKVMSACDVQTLKKCLEENKGDYIQAFKSSGSLGERQTGRNEKQMGHSYPFNSVDARLSVRGGELGKGPRISEEDAVTIYASIDR